MGTEKMMPGQEPYTEKERQRRDKLVADAAAGDPGELGEQPDFRPPPTPGCPVWRYSEKRGWHCGEYKLNRQLASKCEDAIKRAEKAEDKMGRILDAVIDIKERD